MAWTRKPEGSVPVRLDIPAEYKGRLEELARARKESLAKTTRDLMMGAIDRESTPPVKPGNATKKKIPKSPLDSASSAS